MSKYFSFRLIVGIAFLLVTGFLTVSPASSSPARSYSAALRRYPYLTDVVGPYATINWATDRSEISGGVRYGKVGAESCTAHYVAATRTPISVNGSPQYQWKAQLTLEPGEEYCYRVYLGTSPVNAIDLLGGDASPSFWTQVPAGANQSFSFAVIGDWGQVDASGTNSYQADLMSLMASSGARFAITTGDNGYPSGNQKNFGDLIQVGADTSAIFGPSFWKVVGASLPIFPTLGNHGFASPDANHPYLLTWPQDRAVSTSGGRYVKETYCCLNGSTTAAYPSAWYALDAGVARFYMLETAWSESNVGTASEYQMDYDYHWAPGTAQYEWLKADLAAHPSVLKFAFFHYPLYSDNPHEATDTFLLGNSSLEGLLKQNGVDIAFTGHAHIYERNLASAAGVPNYITGGGGATPGTLGTCTALDAYAIKFTTSGKACGSAPVPTSPGQIYHFLKVTLNGTSVTVTPINSLGQSFDVQNYSFTSGAEATAPSTPTNLAATVVSGTQINLSWSASSDNTSVRGYGIYRNGDLVATVARNTLTYSDTKLTPSTSYTYRVDAFDGSGNHSPRSSSRTASTPGTATYTFAPIADAYVAGDLTTTNYGSSSTLRADNSPVTRSYLRFHVDDLNGTVTNATLRLYTTSASSTGYQVKGVNSQSWEEGTIAYGNSPAVGSTLGSSGSIAAGSWTSVNVTALITGNGTYDLALTTTTTSALNFSSRDAGSNQPQLVIQTATTVGPAPTPSPTVSPSQTPTSTRTPTIAPTGSVNMLTFAPLADARVSQTAPTTNYGTATTLTVDGGSTTQTSYLRFNASNINGSIYSVKLRIFCTTNGTPDGPAVYLANNNWNESGSGGITWNTQPTLLSGVIDNENSIGTNSWVEYEVTNSVPGNGTYTFALVADGTDGATFSSREGTTPPQLIVTFGAGAPSASLTATMALSSTAMSTETNSPTATGTPTFTPTATPGSVNTLMYAPAADGRVAQTSPGTNYGTADNLQVDGGSTTQTSYIRFDANSINGPIYSVKLRVFCTTNGTNNGPAVYLADNNWSESGSGGITWNTQPALLSGVIDNKGVIGTNSWVEYDVTSMVSGNNTYTFALVADGTDGVVFSSREGTTPPQLVVTLDTSPSTPSPTSTATMTPTFTGTATQTNTPTHTATQTFTPTSTLTPSPTETYTPTATLTNTPVDTVTFTATFTPTLTPGVTNTATFTPTPTLTPSPTETYTPTATLTDMPTATFTVTSSPTESETPTPTQTSLPTETDTPTFTPTSTLTETDTPTVTLTNTPVEADTPTFIPTPTPVLTDTPTNTPIETDTVTPTPTAADTLTFTPTDVPTLVLTNTPTETDMPIWTPTPAPTSTPTFTPTMLTGFENAVTYMAVADARVVQASPATNYGTSTSLQADGGPSAAQTSYIRFTITDIDEPIQNVKLRIFCTTNGTTNGPAVYLADNDWAESGTGGITWNTQPALLSSAFDNKEVITTSTWVEYDVTALVSGNGTYTFALVADGTDGVTFSSREGTIPPRLVVTLGP